jgi:hypothetical protein
MKYKFKYAAFGLSPLREGRKFGLDFELDRFTVQMRPGQLNYIEYLERQLTNGKRRHCGLLVYSPGFARP